MTPEQKGRAERPLVLEVMVDARETVDDDECVFCELVPGDDCIFWFRELGTGDVYGYPAVVKRVKDIIGSTGRVFVEFEADAEATRSAYDGYAIRMVQE